MPAITQTVYDANGNVTATIDPQGRQTDFTYDVRNRKVREAAPAVNGVRALVDTAYDGVGNVIKVTDARNFVMTMVYDEANRKTQVVAPAVQVVGREGLVNPVTATTYDAAGNVLTVTDPKGRVTTNTYDALNRLVTTTDGAGIVVTNGYDAMGNRTLVKDGLGQETHFAYDGLKRNTAITNALGQTTALAYDGVNKTGRTDGAGQVTTYQYDVRNRLTSVQYSANAGQNRTYSYDAAGRLLSVTEPGGVADVAYGYDALNRVLSETSQGVTHQYGYDFVGNRVTTIYGGTNRVLTSTYDARNRLLTMEENGRTTQYGYDVAGNVIEKTLPNGDKVTTAYDPLNRAVTIASVVGPGHGNAGAVQYSYAQGRDLAGNVAAIAEQTAALPPRFLSMAYDGVDRLVAESELTDMQGKTTTYTYDAANNRSSRTKMNGNTSSTASYAYDAGNRLTGWTEGARAVSYTYDANGSRKTRSENGTMNASYTYDGEQRLIGLSQEGHAYAYRYDYRTRRLQRTEDGVTTKVVFSGGTSVQELEGGASANAPTVEYMRGSDWGGGVGGILYTLRGNIPSFTHYDGRGDVTTKTNGDGAVTYQASYEAFGTRTQEQGATQDRQKANTKEEDPSGLLCEGFRHRDLETGTFTTADPAGFVDGPNVYAYVRQNPWTKFDPHGLADGHHKVGQNLFRANPDKEVESFLDSSEARITSDAYEKRGINPTHGSQTVNGVSNIKYNNAVRDLSTEMFGKVPSQINLDEAKALVAKIDNITTGLDAEAKSAAIIHAYNQGVMDEIAAANRAGAEINKALAASGSRKTFRDLVYEGGKLIDPDGSIKFATSVSRDTAGLRVAVFGAAKNPIVEFVIDHGGNLAKGATAFGVAVSGASMANAMADSEHYRGALGAALRGDRADWEDEMQALSFDVSAKSGSLLPAYGWQAYQGWTNK